MDALHLEYHVAKPALNFSRLALVVGAALLLASSLHAWSLRQEVQDRETSLAKEQRAVKRAPAQKSRALGEESAREITAANDVLRRLALPWGALFSAIEAGRHKNVALLSIEPDAEKLNVRIGAEARTADDMLAYVRLLQETQVLKDVTLGQHQIKREDPQQPVRFTVTAAWVVQ